MFRAFWEPKSSAPELDIPSGLFLPIASLRPRGEQHAVVRHVRLLPELPAALTGLASGLRADDLQEDLGVCWRSKATSREKLTH